MDYTSWGERELIEELQRRDALSNTNVAEWPVTSIDRTDLVEREINGSELTHEDVLKITDEQMSAIARSMSEGLLESGAFWDALDTAAEYHLTD
jgi:hypothetical protein